MIMKPESLEKNYKILSTIYMQVPDQLDHSKKNDKREENLSTPFLAIPISKNPGLFTLTTSDSTKFTLTFLVLQIIAKYIISELFKYCLTVVAMTCPYA